jgi:hypothetical protein
MAPKHKPRTLIGSNSARSAVETACRSQRRTAEDAEDAERAGSLTHTPTSRDGESGTKPEDSKMGVAIPLRALR